MVGRGRTSGGTQGAPEDGPSPNAGTGSREDHSQKIAGTHVTVETSRRASGLPTETAGVINLPKTPPHTVGPAVSPGMRAHVLSLGTGKTAEDRGTTGLAMAGEGAAEAAIGPPGETGATHGINPGAGPSAGTGIADLEAEAEGTRVTGEHLERTGHQDPRGRRQRGHRKGTGAIAVMAPGIRQTRAEDTPSRQIRSATTVRSGV